MLHSCHAANERAELMPLHEAVSHGLSTTDPTWIQELVLIESQLAGTSEVTEPIPKYSVYTACGSVACGSGGVVGSSAADAECGAIACGSVACGSVADATSARRRS